MNMLRMKLFSRSGLVLLAVLSASLQGVSYAQQSTKPSATKEVEAITEEAYLYGFPMVVGYKVIYGFFIDRDSGQFKAPINQISNEARVFTLKDTGISTPNSDTPYSMALLDLRSEPMVLCMPDGFSYHLQEMAFFNWFFGGPSVGVNGWYSDNGTFTSDAGPVCTP